MDLLQTLQQAIKQHQAGQLAEADQLYTQALVESPANADILYLRSVVATSQGRINDAIEFLHHAIAAKSSVPEFYYDLGIALSTASRFREAGEAYQNAIRLRPNYFQAYNNMGNALRSLRRLDDALKCFNHAVSLQPDYTDALYNRGVVLLELSRPIEAEETLREALRLKPDIPEAHNNLGIALQRQHRFPEALAAHREAIRLRPEFAKGYYNLGLTLRELGEQDEARAAFTQAVALQPNSAESLCDLAIAMRNHYEIDRAIAMCHAAIHLDPDHAASYCNLGVLLKDAGDLDGSLAAYHRAATLQPNDARFASNYLFSLLYHPRYDAPALLTAHRRWNDLYAKPLSKEIPNHANKPEPNRRLRIGYVSPDFGEHCQSLFTLPLLRSHDHSNFEIICYSTRVRPDSLTPAIRACADRWCDVAALSDSRLADQIRADEIDILVDLTMHMNGSRLLAFARKPAPVQITWLAYPGTTGLDTIDYRLTDPHIDPPGLDDASYSEKSIRLPDTFWCYDPMSAEPPVNELPALKNGYVTFGCLNNFCKMNNNVLDLWARVLNRVENSKLILLAPAGSAWNRLMDHFKNRGISADRLQRIDFSVRAQYIQNYHRIDIGLDTFPYNGHTTSLDSFWMGVPVITLPGRTVVGRAGVSQLTNLRLTELIAKDPEDFISIAANLAADLARLKQLRSTLRQRMQSSPLMDATRFARAIEAAYRDVWKNWCAPRMVGS